jgi:hypothetical protein
LHDLAILKSGGYRGAGLTQLKLTCPLASFPEEILELDTLAHLDLSGTGLSSLPTNFGPALPNLKTVLFSNCRFKVFPKELASCPSLETVAFCGNGMEGVPEDAFPPHLRCLILTDNRLTSIPSSIGLCNRLQQCMLAGNQLQTLPGEMAQCKQLALLRLSSNNFSTLPSWLFTLPELAFLSFASNPCSSPTTNGVHAPRGLASIAWSDLEVQQPLGADAFQGLWHQSPHFAEDVTIKLFRGTLTNDDGTPADEMAACLAAGAHESLITILGRIHGHPDEDAPITTTPGEEVSVYQGGIVTQLLPDDYTPLAAQPPASDLLQQPPSTSPTQQQQDDHNTTPTMDVPTALGLLTGLAGCLSHLHTRGIAHGSLTPQNILTSIPDAHAVLDLSSFRAATVYGHGSGSSVVHGQENWGEAVEKVEVLAFGSVMGVVLSRVPAGGGDRGDGGDEEKEEVRKGLWDLQGRCVQAEVQSRPVFEEVVEVLEGLMGWRGMMRIPDVHPR